MTGIRILLIEDNDADRELARRALAGLSVPPGPAEVVAVGSWTEAETRLAAEKFDLLLLDFNLPGCTGLEILRALGDRAHPPVVMLTGQGDLATAVETLRAGAYDYVPKSVDSAPALRLTVERVLERVELERELEAARQRLAAHALDLEEKVAARTAMVAAQAAETEALYLKSEEGERVKREIVANVSHELRTPLNAILGYLELLPDELPPDIGDSARAMLNGVSTQSRRLHELVQSLLAVQQLRSGTVGISLSRVSLPALARELRHEAELLNDDKTLRLTWEIPAEPCVVVSDREKLRTIAYHLVSNAIKFTHDGGVRVAFATRDQMGIVLTVSDTGIGLPAESRTLVFDDFRQLDGSSTRRYEGVGLGLGIVRRYTALLGGTLRLDSAPGEGTTITVDLPPPRGNDAAADYPMDDDDAR
jgi:signal transduction histidine kinase